LHVGWSVTVPEYQGRTGKYVLVVVISFRNMK
jgi:hypothetical protein